MAQPWETRGDEMILQDEVRSQLVELANTLSYDDEIGAVEVYDETADYDYDRSGVFGSILRAPIGKTFKLGLTNATSSDLEVTLFDGTSLPTGVTDSPSGRNEKIVTWARGGRQMAIGAVKVSASSQAKRDALLFTIGQETPFGGKVSNEIAPLDFITEKDFSTTIATLPMGFVIDGFTYFKLTVPASDSLTLLFFLQAVANPIHRLQGVKPVLPVKDGVVRLRPALPQPRASLGRRPAGQK